MRSVERFCRTVALLALVVSLSGCAVFSSFMARFGFRSGGTVAAAPATGASGVAVAPAVDQGPPVDAAVRQAFDAAGRALDAGRLDEAERSYRALVASHPELGGPHAGLGVIHRRAGRIPEAVAEFEQAVKLGPRQPVYWNQLGAAYRLQGQFTKAREAYERALALDPAYAAAVLNLGILNDLYLGDAPRALELYGRYLALNAGGDATVTKWVADLKNRKPAPVVVSRKEN